VQEKSVSRANEKKFSDKRQEPVLALKIVWYSPGAGLVFIQHASS
jgi:hypothetical protein